MDRDRRDALTELIAHLRTDPMPSATRRIVGEADHRALAEAIRARPAPWWFLVQDDLTVFATAGMPGTGSAPHDHGIGAVTRCLAGVEGSRHYVLGGSGRLVEHRTTRLDAGRTQDLRPEAIHAVFNCWTEPNLVLHVYAGDFTRSPKRVWDPVTGAVTDLDHADPLMPGP